MPQLITAYVPAVFFSQQNISFAAAGLNASNTKILYRVGNPTVSWVPDDLINPLTGLEYNRGYLIEPIADIVLADNVAQTQICQEQNPGGVPVGYVTTLDISFPISGTQASFTRTDLIGNIKITLLTRDGNDYVAIPLTGGLTPSGLSPKLQVLYDNTNGTVYAHPDNPFSDTEQIHINAQKSL